MDDKGKGKASEADVSLQVAPPDGSGDIWRPVAWQDPPAPPSMARRQAEEQALEMAAMQGHGRQDGRPRKVRPRRTVDMGGSMARWYLMRSLRTTPNQRYLTRPGVDYLIELLPPQAYPDNPSTSILSKYVHTSTNKVRCPINVVRYMPDARRVLTGATSGEFTLWNSLTFNFETILQAHDTAVRAVDWSHSGVWLVSGENSGTLKYFQPNMNNLQAFHGHDDSVRDVSFAPNDVRFATCGDDRVIKIWSFEERREERTLTGHGWDVKCCKWHKTKGLLCSGGKDSLVKFWDPRTATCLTTLHGHKNSVQACAWNPSGHTVATASRDQTIKVFDIRMMKELATLRGHKKEVCSIAWHPIHHDVLVSGGSEGSILHWCLPDSTPVDVLEYAHDSNVWSLDYHPMGHTLVSGSNDHTTRFWSRGRPGVKIANDRFHVGKDRAKEMGAKDEDERDDDFFVPGLSQQYPSGGGRGANSGALHHSSDRNPAIPGFGRANADTFASSAPDSQGGGWRRGPLPSQLTAIGRDLGDPRNGRDGPPDRRRQGRPGQWDRSRDDRDRRPPSPPGRYDRREPRPGGPPRDGGWGTRGPAVDEFGREIQR